MLIVKLILIFSLLLFRPTNWFIANFLILFNPLILIVGKQLLFSLADGLYNSNNQMFVFIGYMMFVLYKLCNFLYTQIASNVPIMYGKIKEYEPIKTIDNGCHIVYKYVDTTNQNFKSYIITKITNGATNLSKQTIYHLQSNPDLLQQIINKSGHNIDANIILSLLPRESEKKFNEILKDFKEENDTNDINNPNDQNDQNIQKQQQQMLNLMKMMGTMSQHSQNSQNLQNSPFIRLPLTNPTVTNQYDNSFRSETYELIEQLIKDLETNQKKGTIKNNLVRFLINHNRLNIHNLSTKQNDKSDTEIELNTKINTELNKKSKAKTKTKSKSKLEKLKLLNNIKQSNKNSDTDSDTDSDTAINCKKVNFGSELYVNDAEIDNKKYN
jgi:hypothetical protein